MKGFDVAQIIISQPVREAVDRAKNVGRLLASIEALLLAFVCWYRVHTGAPVAHDRQGLVPGDPGLRVHPADASAQAPASSNGSGRSACTSASCSTLAQGFLMENFDKAVGRHAQQILDIQVNAVPNMRAEDSRALEAIAWQFSNPWVAGLVGVNAIGIYLMKMVMQVSYAWLIAFYWMLTPLVAPMVILPADAEHLPWLAADVHRRGAVADVLRVRGATRARGSLECLDGRHGRRDGQLGAGDQVVPGRDHAPGLQRHLLLRVPVDPDRQPSHRLWRIPTVPQPLE